MKVLKVGAQYLVLVGGDAFFADDLDLPGHENGSLWGDFFHAHAAVDMTG